MIPHRTKPIILYIYIRIWSLNICASILFYTAKVNRAIVTVNMFSSTYVSNCVIKYYFVFEVGVESIYIFVIPV